VVSATWEHLHALRQNGQRPAMKVIVTTNWRLAYGMDELGVMAIVHKRGEPMPVELLDGLSVIFWLNDCAQNEAVLRLIGAKGVRLADYECWCPCFNELTKFVVTCKTKRELADWIDAWKPAA
jgi:hypothetical protein